MFKVLISAELTNNADHRNYEYTYFRSKILQYF